MKNCRCGRLDEHEPHFWEGPRQPGGPTPQYRCPGTVVIEGGYFAGPVVA